MPYYFSPFRALYQEDLEHEKTNKPDNYCVFCDDDTMRAQSLKNSAEVIYENELYRWIVNWFPRAEGHTMLIPKRHIIEISDETDTELLARQDILKQAMAALSQTFGATGFEIFLQTGKGSAGTKSHLHWHLIPTIIQHDFVGMEKLGYLSTTEPTPQEVVLTPTEITIARDKLIELIEKKN